VSGVIALRQLCQVYTGVGQSERRSTLFVFFAKCFIQNFFTLLLFLAGGSPSDGSTMSAMGDAGLIGGGFGSGGSFGGAGGMPSGGFFGNGGPASSGGAPGLGGSPGSVGLGIPGALQRRSTSTAGLEGGAYGMPNAGTPGMQRASSVPLGYGSGLPGGDPSSSLSGGSSSSGSGAAGDLFAVSASYLVACVCARNL